MLDIIIKLGYDKSKMKLRNKLNGLYFSVLAASDLQVDEGTLQFSIPTFGDILTFIIRLFFVLAGIAALLYLLLGAFTWITSGGDKERVEKARDKIQAAIVGVILVVIVVAILATLETVVFSGKLCFGLTCPVSIPALLK